MLRAEEELYQRSLELELSPEHGKSLVLESTGDSDKADEFEAALSHKQQQLRSLFSTKK